MRLNEFFGIKMKLNAFRRYSEGNAVAGRVAGKLKLKVNESGLYTLW